MHQPHLYFHCSFENLCNLRCFFCYERPHCSKDEVEPAAIVLQRVAAARKAGYDTVVFASGELVMHPHWEELVRGAAALGFSVVGLVSNLTLINERMLGHLARAGITYVAGTILADSDEDAAAITGVAQVVSRQRRALDAISRFPEMGFVPHFLVTRPWKERFLDVVSGVLDRLGDGVEVVQVSAVEPISSNVRRHAAFTDAATVPWERLLLDTRRRGLTLQTQNVPACVLGEAAHTNWTLRRRLARISQGWTGDSESDLLINRNEGLFRSHRVRSPVCQFCGHGLVCQNVSDTESLPAAPSEGSGPQHTIGEALQAMGLEHDRDAVDRALRGLRWIENQEQLPDRGPTESEILSE